MSRRSLWQALRIVVSTGLIALLLYRMSPGRLAVSISGLDPALLAVAVGIFLLSSLLGAAQWHILLRAGGVPLGFSISFRLYFTGLFFNNLLPTNVGGDAVKIYDVTRAGHDSHRVFAITLLDRIFGITGLCLLAIAASVVLITRGGSENLPFYMLIFAACLIPVFLLTLNRRISRAVRRAFSRISLWRLGERFELVFGHLGSLRRVRRLLARVILLSLLIQALRITTHVAVASALGLSPGATGLLHFFVFVPLLGLVMTLPISINGLGIREGAGVLLFTRIGMSEEQAFLMEFITYVVMVGVSLLGGLIFLRRQMRG